MTKQNASPPHRLPRPRETEVSPDRQRSWFAVAKKKSFKWRKVLLPPPEIQPAAADRRQIVDHLRAGEKRFRDLVEGSIQGILVHRDFVPIFANRACAEMYGYDNPQDILALGTVDRLLAPDECQRIRRFAEDRLQGKAVPTQYELRARRRDGSLFWIELRPCVVEWDGRDAIQVTLIDIDERKRAEVELREAHANLERLVAERTRDLADEIAARQQTEDSLRESEEKYRNLVDNMDDGVFLVQHGKLTFANRGIANLLGYAADAMIGRPYVDFVAPSSRHKTTSRHQRRIAGEAVESRYEADLLHRDGRTIPVLLNLTRVVAPRGETVVLGTIKDITERKQAEIALRESEERFKALFDNSPQSINLKDIDGRYLLVNPEWERQHGTDGKDALGRTSVEVFGPETGERLAGIETDVRATGKTRTFETSVLLPDGRQQTRLITKFPILDGAGRISGIGTVGTDISEHKAMEKALRDSEEQFRALIDNSPLIINLKDATGHFLLVNHEFERNHGKSARDVLGKTTRDLFDEASSKAIEAADKRVLETGQAVNFEVEFPAPDGSVQTHLATKFPIRDSSGVITRLGVVSMDISDSKRAEKDLVATRDELEIRVRERTRALEQEILERQYAEQALQEANAELERRVEERTRHLRDEIAERKKMEAQFIQAQKMEAVGQLAGGIAHDFNNLLTVIQGNLSWLNDVVKADAKTTRLMAMALEAARRAGLLTHRMLAFSRRQDLRPEAVDLRRTLEGMEPLIARAVSEVVKVEIEIADDHWPLMIDPHQLESAILNIVLNARDAMPNGGNLGIRVKNSVVNAAQADRYENVEAGDYVLLSITDTGTGMPPEVVERVFDPFFTTKEVGKGSGLGLSMVFGFVNQSGGFIELSSAVGKGTVVNIYLPRAREQVPVAEAEGQERAPSVRPGITVLVVEDDALVRGVTVEYLKMAGIDTLQASDGRTAIGALERGNTVDVVLSDVIMPGGMSGLDLAQIIRQRWPETIVLFMSGYSYDEFARHGINADTIGLLRKPFTKRELLRKIEDATTMAEA